MDRIDRLLAELPPEKPDANLANRLRSHFHRRYQRARRMQLGLTLALIIAGGSLVLPQAYRLSGLVDLPENGLVVANNTIGAFASPIDFWNGAASSISAVQNGLLGALQVTFWIGLFVLALGAIMGMGWLLPTGNKE
jgi:hypothetical protein